MKRDIQLDIYRGISMVYIVCVIHVMYWLGMGTPLVKSVLLIEMPVIFFISGASVSLTNYKQRSFKEILINRFKRVVLPYYAYALVSVAILIMVSFIPPIVDKWGMSIEKYTLWDLCKILVANDIPLMPYVWHLWFIFPYFVISVSIVLQAQLLRYIHPVAYLSLNFILCLLFSNLKRHVDFTPPRSVNIY